MTGDGLKVLSLSLVSNVYIASDQNPIMSVFFSFLSTVEILCSMPIIGAYVIIIIIICHCKNHGSLSCRSPTKQASIIRAFVKVLESSAV